MMKTGLDIETNEFFQIRTIQVYMPDRDYVILMHTNPTYFKDWKIYEVKITDYETIPEVIQKENYTDDEVRRLIVNSNVVVHNSYFDDFIFFRHFKEHLNVVGDSFVFSNLLPKINMYDSNSLQDCMSRDYPGIYNKGLFGEWKDFDWDQKVLSDEAIMYAARDAKAHYDLETTLVEKYPKFANSIYQLELKLIPVLTQMRVGGNLIDKTSFDEAIQLSKVECDDLQGQLNTIVGKELNPTSPKQVGELLFETLNLPAPKKTKTGGYSTNEEVLSKINHPVAQLILKTRKVKKMVSDYQCTLINSPLIEFYEDERFNVSYSIPPETLMGTFDRLGKELKKNYNKKTKLLKEPLSVGERYFLIKYIHFYANQQKTRFEENLEKSSAQEFYDSIKIKSDLDLIQYFYVLEAGVIERKKSSNFVKVFPEFKPLSEKHGGRIFTANPATTNWTKHLRKTVIPSLKENSFYGCDVSAAELMLIAFYAGEKMLVSAYSGGRDLHKEVAAELFNIPDPESVTDEQRETAKCVEYAIIFGSKGNSIAEELQIPQDEAKKLVESFLQKYSKINALKEFLENKAMSTGFAITPFGRRKKLYSIDKDIEAAKRQAVNTFTQSGFADIFKNAIIAICNDLPVDCKLVTTVHDFLLIEFPIKLYKKKFFDKIILRHFKISNKGKDFQFLIKSGIGQNWTETKQKMI